ncbi:MAG TPA: type II toxin-antitoxin system VapC family toxin [Terracidiphilus sp.]|jgi:PIN domain nuclease of toxin-antitoxin system
MKILLDTRILFWWFYIINRVPALAREQILAAETVYVSSASILEIAVKGRLKKIAVDPMRLAQSIEATGFHELPVTARHAAMVASLPPHHSDPFDRILIAQAMSEPLHLITTDAKLKPYSELVVLV